MANMDSMTTMTVDEINSHNLSTSNHVHLNKHFICVSCKRYVSIDESYSDHFTNLHCIDCIEKLASSHKISQTSYVRKFIHNC